MPPSLSPQALQLLEVLAQLPPGAIKMDDLAALVGCSRRRLQTRLGRLDAQGYLRRRIGPTGVVVHLLPPGLASLPMQPPVAPPPASSAPSPAQPLFLLLPAAVLWRLDLYLQRLRAQGVEVTREQAIEMFLVRGLNDVRVPEAPRKMDERGEIPVPPRGGK